ncbi:MAG: methylmalonyl Co-A mutase-associated GTPase MeaB [Acidimicrobiales bacterium]
MTSRATHPEALIAGARQGDRVALARLLSMVERGAEPSRTLAGLAYRHMPPYSVGLTGAPGAGKSTLTNRLITVARNGWPRSDRPPEPVPQVAVLAVDPSSPFSGGAILGDRVRMQDHATDPSVFIRSMATRGHLGGLALAVPDALRVLGAVGFPLVLVETVGVGQMEVEVAAATDTTVVVVTPGWGDSMQANKAGLLEVADLFVVNKADRPGTREARRDLEQMLDLSHPGTWRPPIIETVASSGDGVDLLWAEVARHREHLTGSGDLDRRRKERVTHVLRRVLTATLLEEIERAVHSEGFAWCVRELDAGALDPYTAAERLLGDRAGWGAPPPRSPGHFGDRSPPG